MTTLDFNLEINPGIDSIYPVIARAPGGEATATMRLPVSLAELDHQLAAIRDAVLASSAVVRGAPTAGEQPVRELGRRLFDALITGDVRSLYVAGRQRAREDGAVLRLVLRVRPPELARLPWEFLFDPGRQDYLGLSLPLVRYPELLAPRQPLQVATPIRILGMVARPEDQSTLKVDEEQSRLRTALAGLERDGLVELFWVAGQTYGDLGDALDGGPWHVFHFVGHGGYDRELDEGTLALADDAGRTHLVGADDFSRLLAEHYPLRLVVLNACDTGRGSASDPFSSTAAALIRREIPAVVAMQFEITDQAAIVFSQTFYKNVAKRLAVDTSVVRARQALRLAKKDTLEWGTPVLYLRAPNGRIFDTTNAASTPGASLDEAGGPDIEALYDEALAAFWTERWDQAIALLQQVLVRRPHHPDAPAKLEQARHQRRLANRYAQACAAAEAHDWEEAIAGFTVVAEADPAYRDVTDRLDNARRRQQIAGLHAEARRLHRAGRWDAVVKVGERLQTLDPAAADPDGLVTSARAELTSAARAEQLAAQYRSGLRLLDAGQWRQAVEALAPLDPSYRDTSALLDRARRELPDPPPPPPDSSGPARHPKVVQTVQHEEAVNAVVFSLDGRLLATASHDETARIWDTTNGQEQLSVRHKGFRSNVRGRAMNVRGRAIQAVAFSPDGLRLATAGDDYTARIWDVEKGKQLATLTHDNTVREVAFSPDGRLLATACADRIARVWDAGSGKKRATLTHEDQVYGVAFSPDGHRLVTAGGDRTARIWDADTGRKLATIFHDKAVLAVAFSPDGLRLATAGDDRTARIWGADNGQQLAVLAHGNRVWAVAYSTDGRWLATAGDDYTARIWDAGSGQELAILTHDHQVYGVAFSPEGHRLATASRDKTVRIWSLLRGPDDE